jgi:hypothetical protein
LNSAASFVAAALPAKPGLENSDIVPKDNLVIAPGNSWNEAAVRALPKFAKEINDKRHDECDRP